MQQVQLHAMQQVQASTWAMIGWSLKDSKPVIRLITERPYGTIECTPCLVVCYQNPSKSIKIPDAMFRFCTPRWCSFSCACDVLGSVDWWPVLTFPTQTEMVCHVSMNYLPTTEYPMLARADTLGWCSNWTWLRSNWTKPATSQQYFHVRLEPSDALCINMAFVNLNFKTSAPPWSSRRLSEALIPLRTTTIYTLS